MSRFSRYGRTGIERIMNPGPPFETTAELYPQDSFRREDETNDRLFYNQPRLVVHVDDFATAAIERYFGRVLPSGGVVLDLMSSWRSHMSKDLQTKRLVGLGLNAVEMAENPRLNEAVVHDINTDPNLPFDDGCFDAVVLTVSVQYIVRPIEVFRQVSRVLTEGASFRVVYSNRMFPTKAVAIWKELDDARRARLITSYFHSAGGWDSPQTLEIGSRKIPHADPVYVVTARKANGAESPESNTGGS